MIRRRLALFAAVLAVAALAVVVPRPQPAAADLSGSQFQAGNIVSDAVFYNSSTMTAATVQSFLNAQYQGCSRGYVCVRDYTTATTTRPAETGLCNTYTGRASETAAAIIYNVGHACGVNPQMLLVLLQKESSLITTTTPNYQTAAGFGCPDSTGCASKYFGFFNQVYGAARSFKYYRLHPTDYNYVAGRSNFILYNPKTSCGGTNVFIQNQATAGLYDYTPYQPNAAALNNLHGTGDSCSAYGNRNFWVFYHTWFSPPAPPAAPYDAGGLVGTKADGTLWYAPNNSGAATHPYSPAVEIGLGGWQGFDKLAVGDIDGDGRGDIVATRPDGTLWVYPNNGTSLPFVARHQIPGPSWGEFDRLYVADIDGDGRADLITTKPGGSLWMYHNTGNAAAPFPTATQIGASGWQGFTKLVLGDLDGDGRADLLGIRADGSLTRYLNNGTTHPFSTSTRISTVGWQGYRTVVATDVDLDGRADLLGTVSNGRLNLYHNRAEANPFGPAALIGASGWQAFVQLASTTVPVPRRAVTSNIVATQPAGTLWSAANDDPPTPYQGPARIGTAGWGAYDLLVAGDVNGDGKPDLVARKPAGSLWLYKGTGVASSPYGAATEIGLGGWQQFVQIAALDANQDGKADLVLTLPDGTMWLALSTAATPATPYQARTRIGAGGWTQFNRLLTGDVTGDNRPDLLATKSDGSMWEYAGTGQAAAPFATGVQVTSGGWNAYSRLALTAPTVPRPGHPAELVATRPDGSLWFFRNVGPANALFGPGEKIGLGGWQAFSKLVASDVDGDQLADLVVTRADGSLWLYRNKGTGPFATASKIGASGWQAFDKLTSGDVDGDGRPDLVLSQPDGTLWLYRNNGSASAPYSGRVKIGLGGWQGFDRILVGDVTGDGLADLVATKADGTLWLYVNTGNAAAPFSPRSQIGLGGWQGFTKLDLADVTGDGLADLVGVRSDGTLWLYPDVHLPSHPFSPRTEIGLGGWNAMAQVALGDVNHDGKADVVTTTADGRMLFYPNTGDPLAPIGPRVQVEQTGWQAFDRIVL